MPYPPHVLVPWFELAFAQSESGAFFVLHERPIGYLCISRSSTRRIFGRDRSNVGYVSLSKAYSTSSSSADDEEDIGYDEPLVKPKLSVLIFFSSSLDSVRALSSASTRPRRIMASPWYCGPSAELLVSSVLKSLFSSCCVISGGIIAV